MSVLFGTFDRFYSFHQTKVCSMERNVLMELFCSNAEQFKLDVRILKMGIFNIMQDKLYP